MPRHTINWFPGAPTKCKAGSAVSLHSHTSQSLETLAVVATYKDRNRLIRGIVERAERVRIGGEPSGLDFSNLYFTPPLPPAEALAVEQKQIVDSFDCLPLVSLTDHDTFATADILLRRSQSSDIPFSTEWTIPCESTYLHLGVHNVPRRAVASLERRMRRISQGCNVCRDRDSVCFGAHRDAPNAAWTTDAIGDVLDELSGYGEVLTVLNHPAWDLGGIGDSAHRAIVGRFLAIHGHAIHALEVNGLRSWPENLVAMDMAASAGLPVVAGGDRHGCEPAAVLNLSRSDTFAGFVSEIRRERLSTVILMPQYREPLRFRKLQAVWDVLRTYPNHADGRRDWTERIFIKSNGEGYQSLSTIWSGARSGPAALEASRRIAMTLERWPLRNAVRLVCATERRMVA